MGSVGIAPPEVRSYADVPLGGYTTFGIGGPARRMWVAQSCRGAAAAVRRAAEEGLRLRLLGGGSNLLVADAGVEGAVLRLEGPELGAVRRVDEAGTVEAGGAARLAYLLACCARWGLAGAEGLVGIPGSVGAALRMNAGGRQGQIGDLVADVTAVEPDGRCRTFTREECGFAYRASALAGRVVLGCRLKLQPDNPAAVRARLWRLLHQKAAAQPLGARSAGCVFKNPPGEAAGRLIQLAGLKGRRRGGAVVSPLHANFIVNEHDATASDVLGLIAEVRDAVYQHWGTWLELEVELWGIEAAAVA